MRSVRNVCMIESVLYAIPCIEKSLDLCCSRSQQAKRKSRKKITRNAIAKIYALPKPITIPYHTIPNPSIISHHAKRQNLFSPPSFFPHSLLLTPSSLNLTSLRTLLWGLHSSNSATNSLTSSFMFSPLTISSSRIPLSAQGKK